MKESLDRLENVVEHLVEKSTKRRVYISETEKIRSRVMEFINDGMVGIDIGCGNDKIFKTAMGIDGRRLFGVDLVADVTQLGMVFGTNKFEYVYSSHCLEHIGDTVGTLKQWISLLRDGGIIVLYLPHKDYYVVHNPEHLHRFNQTDIEELLKGAGCKITCSEMDLGYDRYSFLVVGEKECESIKP